MVFQISPGIVTSEVDLTTTTPAISTSVGAFAGPFSWGPVETITQVSSEDVLVSRYGKPNNENFESFFSAANFLAYSRNLLLSRAATTTGKSITNEVEMDGTNIIVANAVIAVANGDGVYGDGIQPNTVVTNVVSDSTSTTITISRPTTLGTSTGPVNNQVNFFDTAFTFNAVANSGVAVDRNKYIIKNSEDFEGKNFDLGIEFVARYPGAYGNSLKVSVCSSPEQFSSTINPWDIDGHTSPTEIPGDNTGITVEVGTSIANVYISNSATLNFSDTYIAAGAIQSKFEVGDIIEVGNTSIGKQSLRIKNILPLQNTNPMSPTGTTYFNIEFDGNYTRPESWSANTINRSWEFASMVTSAPGTSESVRNFGNDAIDQVSVVVVDELGSFTGTAGQIVEVYNNLSRAIDAKSPDGTTAYYKTYINDTSRYIWNVNDIPGADSSTSELVENSTSGIYTKSFKGGTNGAGDENISVGSLAKAIDKFNDNKTTNISFVISGKTRGLNGAQYVNYLVDNIAEVRKDCVVYASPRKEDIVGTSVDGEQADRVRAFYNNVRKSSYLFKDSGYKYQYDKYNDVYRWIPLNGDIAGVSARSDMESDPWFSPAGFNRGHIKNVVKLAWNPNEAERDAIYKDYINPVVSFQGQGTILYGDKTGLGLPSAFDRINVRRLFNILKTTITEAAQGTLFEFNDEFTRANFKNLVEPFLRDIMGRRGIYNYSVICDETNNTPQVIDSNRFVADIYIKPSRSINFIQLNFVAVGSGVEFNEIVGGA